MRPRVEVALGLALLGAVVIIAAALGGRNRGIETDWRPTTYSTGPHGTSGVAAALGRMGIEVHRFRLPVRQIWTAAQGPGRSAFVILGGAGLTESDARLLARVSAARDSGTDLVLAGDEQSPAMACFGFGVEVREDSVRVTPAGVPADVTAPWTRQVLASTTDTVVTDSSQSASGIPRICGVAPIAREDTLLTTLTGRLVAVRLERADNGRVVVLVADGGLFGNRTVRESGVGPVLLGALAAGYAQVTFDEYVHGFSSGGSLGAATLAWSTRSPLGWAAWQLVAVGLLALGFGAFRFGRPRSAIPRQRRSPLEHVRALATALAAAQGHDVAIGAIVQGLRRRLVAGGERGRGDWRSWLGQLSRQTRGSRGRDAVATLVSLTQPGQPSSSVLRAANAVEDAWEELRPSPRP